MDTHDFSFQEFSRYLIHLEYINRFSFAYYPVLQWLKRERLAASPKRWSILDVGSGRGDMARKIWRLSQQYKFSVTVTGIDINPFATMAAARLIRKGVPVYFKTEDVFTYTLKTKPDYIISVQFTHHLNDAELVTFIKWLDRNACQGWFINDLHRHPIPYYGIKFALRLLPVHRFTKYDGPLSVARAFTKKDWQGLLNEAGIEKSRISIRWHFPYRYTVTCSHPQNTGNK